MSDVCGSQFSRTRYSRWALVLVRVSETSKPLPVSVVRFDQEDAENFSAYWMVYTLLLMVAKASVRVAAFVGLGRISRVGPRVPPFQLAKIGELGGAVVPLLRRETMPIGPVVVMR